MGAQVDSQPILAENLSTATSIDNGIFWANYTHVESQAREPPSLVIRSCEGSQDFDNDSCDEGRFRELDALKPDSVCISSQRVLKLYLVVLGVRTSLELSQYNLHLFGAYLITFLFCTQNYNQK